MAGLSGFSVVVTGRTGAAEQVRDFARARGPAHRGLRDQDRETGERADLGDRGAEHETEPGQDQAAGNWLAPPTGPP